MAKNAIKEAYRAGYEFGIKQASEKVNIGHWIAEKVDHRHYHYYCSNCGNQSKYRKGKYCSECGYKMES